MPKRPFGEVYTVASKYDAELLKGESAAGERLARAFAASWKEIDGAVRDLDRQIRIDRAAGRDTTSKRFQSMRLKTIREQVFDYANRAMSDCAVQTANLQSDFVDAAERHSLGVAVASVPAKQKDGIEGAWNRANLDAVRKGVGFFAPGSPIRDALESKAAGYADAFADILATQLTAGWNPVKAAREARDRFGADLAYAQSVLRTESFRAYRAANRESFQANDDVLDGWVWNAHLNDAKRRTCAACIAMHGTVHPLDEPMGTHANCRCTQLPLVKGASWHKEQETGAEWFEGQGAGVQEAILGKAKYAAFAAKEFKFAALVGFEKSPKWGAVRYERSLLSLQSNPKTIPGAFPVKARAKKPVAIAAVSVDVFPTDPATLKLIRTLGGSTGAELVEDSSGNLFVRKKGANADHLREEATADAMYQAAGFAVPEYRLYDSGGVPVKLSRFVEGESLGAVKGRDPALYARITAELREGFAMDAVIGNWDVIGMNYDNVLVDTNGKAWRIDNGGSLRFRAQGAVKGAAWNPHPTELFTLRSAAVNAQTAEVFAGVSVADLVKGLDAVAANEAAVLGAIPASETSLRTVFAERLKSARDTARTAAAMVADEWTDDYAQLVMRHRIGIRAAGITGDLPKELKSAVNDRTNKAVDENGIEWDNMRPIYNAPTGNDLTSRFKNYVDSNGGKHSAVAKYCGSQGGDSWSTVSETFKEWLTSQARTTPQDSYFWKSDTIDRQVKLQGAFAAVGSEALYTESFAALHAFSQEILGAIDFRNNDRASGTIALVRTESGNTLRAAYGVADGDLAARFKRGAAESSSVWTPIRVYGDTYTVYKRVPHHRVLATFFMGRDGTNPTAFAGDYENEFVTMLDGLPCEVHSDARKLPRTFEGGTK